MKQGVIIYFNDFLSNLYPYCSPDTEKAGVRVDICYRGQIYDCVETAYLAAQLKNPADRRLLVNMTPFQAHQFMAQPTVEKRLDWEKIKLPVMKYLLAQKFKENGLIIQNLLKTGTQPLLYLDYAGDSYWENRNGVGQNRMGRLLMRQRTALIQNGHQIWPKLQAPYLDIISQNNHQRD